MWFYLLFLLSFSVFALHSKACFVISKWNGLAEGHLYFLLVQTCYVSVSVVLFVKFKGWLMANVCDAMWLCWGEKILQFFLSDTKLASREKAKLCFKAVRCKNSEGKFSFEWGNTSEGEYSWDVVYCSWLWCWNNAFSFYPLENYTFADIVFGNEQVS